MRSLKRTIFGWENVEKVWRRLQRTAVRFGKGIPNFSVFIFIFRNGVESFSSNMENFEKFGFAFYHGPDKKLKKPFQFFCARFSDSKSATTPGTSVETLSG